MLGSVLDQAAGNERIVLLMNGFSPDARLGPRSNSLFMRPQRVQQHGDTVQRIQILL